MKPDSRTSAGSSAHQNDEADSNLRAGLPAAPAPSNKARGRMPKLSIGVWILIGVVAAVLVGWLVAIQLERVSVDFFCVASLFAGALMYICIRAIVERMKDDRMAKNWSEVAKETSLELQPGPDQGFLSKFQRPSLSGVYRRHWVSISKIVKDEGYGDEGERVAYTKISVEVENTAGSFLQMQSRPVFKLFNGRSVSSGNEDFNRRFWFGGRPEDFLQEALQIIVRHPVLLGRSGGNRSIELKGRELVYLQRGRITSSAGLLPILEVMCELADLAEDRRQM